MNSFWTYFIVQVPVRCLERDHFYVVRNKDLELSTLMSWRDLGIHSILAIILATCEVTYTLLIETTGMDDIPRKNMWY